MKKCVMKLSTIEQDKSLDEISIRLQKILYVYEQSQNDPKYDFKDYVQSVLLYVRSANDLMNYNLTNIIVDLNCILSNPLEKSDIKRIVFQDKNFIKKMKQQGDCHGEN